MRLTPSPATTPHRRSSTSVRHNSDAPSGIPDSHPSDAAHLVTASVTVSSAASRVTGARFGTAKEWSP
ncbi:hypothetical protein GCM10017776_33660 [Streptomyces griseoluteus]|nr:hypothetical protein GCM10017776_33660 [Streptomyces griseoluteus]